MPVERPEAVEPEGKLPPEQEQWLDAVERALNMRLGEIQPEPENPPPYDDVVPQPPEERGEFMAIVDGEEDDQRNIELGVEQRQTTDAQGRILEEQGEFLALGDDEDEDDIEVGVEQRARRQRDQGIPFEAPPPYDPPPPYDGARDEMNEEELEEPEIIEHRELPGHEEAMEEVPNEHRQLHQRKPRVYNEGPPADSPLRVEQHDDGTMIIDSHSVPATISPTRPNQQDQDDRVTFQPTPNSLNVEGLITPPMDGRQNRLQSVFATGATGYLQKFPDIEDSVIKRPYIHREGPGEPVQFVGGHLIAHEAKILTALSQFKEAKGASNIIDYRGSGVTEFGEPFLIMEEMLGGTAAERIPDEHGMEEQQLNNFAKGLLSGMGFLQKRNVIHQDLKADNILFRDNDSEVPVISDFDTASSTVGVAADHEVGHGHGYQRGGSPEIQPPEAFEPESPKTGKIDSWNGGILMLQAAVGTNARNDFINDTFHFRLENGVRDQVEFDAILEAHTQGVPENIKAAIKGMLRIDLDERLTAEQALALVEPGEAEEEPEQRQ